MSGARSPWVRRGYLDTPEGQIHYRESGSGAPVVLLHQTASSSVMWERVMRQFPAGFRLLAPDTPGFGSSDPPSGPPASGLAYYAGRIRGFLQALGIEQATVVGHHTGAMIAAELAAAHPELVRKLVCIGCVVIDDAAERRQLLDHIDRWTADARGNFVTETLIPRMHLSVTTDDSEHMVQELTAYLQAGPDYWWAYGAVFSYRALERLPLISTRTLCVVGTREPESLVRWTREASRLIGGSTYTEVVDATAEMVMQEPETVAELVTAFLST